MKPMSVWTRLFKLDGGYLFVEGKHQRTEKYFYTNAIAEFAQAS